MEAIFRLLRGVQYLFLRRDALVEEIASFLESKTLRFHAEFSGRCAIRAVAERVARESGGGVALLPDYICNVVYMAVEIAGWTICPYETDELGEADPEKVWEAVRRTKAKLLVTASVFGSSALLDWLSREITRRRLVGAGVHVLVDLCQDIRLAKRLPQGYGPSLEAVVSFNEKSIPGIMGGGILSERVPIPPERELPSMRRVRLLFWALWRSIRGPEWLRRGYGGAFEYSTGVGFPYELERFPAQRLQLAFALAGLRDLERFQVRQSEWWARQGKACAPTRYGSSAPYVQVLSEEKVGEQRRRKAPYACPGRPEESVRPNQRIVHNKGFWDESVSGMGLLKTGKRLGRARNGAAHDREP